MGSFSKTNVFFSALLLSLLVAFFVILIHWRKIIDTPSTNGLKGSAVNSTSTLSQSGNITRICLVSLLDIEQYGKTANVSKSEGNPVLVCNPVSGDYDRGVDDSFFTVRNLGMEDITSNQDALRQNQWFIEYSNEWVNPGNHDSRAIMIPDNHSIITIDPSNVGKHHSVDPNHQRKLASGLEERQRRLLTTVGERTVVVVAVDTSAFTYDELYDYVFGQNHSLKSQMNGCSQGQVTIVPHPEKPIINVSPKKDPSEYTFVELYTAVLDDIKEQLRLYNGRSVTSTTDHLFLIVPDRIERQAGELGWGATPGFFAGIIESLVPSTMTMLHEIGHNHGLGHAHEGGEYGDMSTVMGYSHRNVVKMCYNGQNMHSLGWFPDRSYEIQLSGSTNDRELVNVAFYGDYNKTTSSEPVVVRFKDIYLTFNRQKGINLETKEYPDTLLVVREIQGQYHPYTNLEAALSVGDKPFQMNWTTVNTNNGVTYQESAYFEVCSYTAEDDITPDMLTVAVGRQPGGCPHVSIATTAESTQNNRGNSAATSQQPLQCRTQWPWVEITSSYYSGDVSYLFCEEEIKQNPHQYCEMIDRLSDMEVWKICRLACPQSNCVAEASAMSRISEPSLVEAPERNVRSQIRDDCINLFSKVTIDISDSYTDGQSQLVTKTCEELAKGSLQTRQYFCDEVDTVTSLRISEICKVECPNSKCA